MSSRRVAGVGLMCAMLALSRCRSGGSTHAKQSPTASTETPVAMRNYRNPYYGVELTFPANWAGDPGYSGELGGLWTAYTSPSGRVAGFVQLEAVSAPNLAYAVDATAHHKLKPYGDNPVVSDIRIPAGSATLILPDRARADLDEAALLMPFPDGLRGGVAPIPTQYPYLVLYARVQDIESIASGLRFMDPASLATPVSPPLSGPSQ